MRVKILARQFVSMELTSLVRMEMNFALFSLETKLTLRSRMPEKAKFLYYTTARRTKAEQA